MSALGNLSALQDAHVSAFEDAHAPQDAHAKTEAMSALGEPSDTNASTQDAHENLLGESERLGEIEPPADAEAF